MSCSLLLDQVSSATVLCGCVFITRPVQLLMRRALLKRSKNKQEISVDFDPPGVIACVRV